MSASTDDNVRRTNATLVWGRRTACLAAIVALVEVQPGSLASLAIAAGLVLVSAGPTLLWLAATRGQ